jgi:hypothetical protein
VELERVAHLVAVDLVRRAGQAQEVHFEIAMLGRRHAGREECGVENDARPNDATRLSGEPVLRVVSDKTTSTAELVHDLVARIDACRTRHALHLDAMSDVDARGADDDAAFAVDAIPGALGALLPRGSPRRASQPTTSECSSSSAD